MENQCWGLAPLLAPPHQGRELTKVARTSRWRKGRTLDRRHETKDIIQKTGDKRQEAKDRKPETGNKRQEKFSKKVMGVNLIKNTALKGQFLYGPNFGP